MSKLDELIRELCPDGVEFVPLWSVTIWDKKFNNVDREKQRKVISYPYLLANVAQYWRIRTGIAQGDTALSTEMNLTLALENYGREVDFETVWGAGHTMAERTGNSTENFIEWVNECLK
jgi:hypothetical protein